MRTTHLLYLHGFRSSPQSVKAQIMAKWVQARHPGVTWWCPQLPASPAQAIDLLLQGTADWPREEMAVMGSSLGGFYAAWLSAHWGIPAVLINPAVQPSRDLARHIGEHPVWQDPAQSIFFEPGYVQELISLESQPLPTCPAKLALIAKGDLPATMVGTHRRIRFADLQTYQARVSASRSKALTTLMRETRRHRLGY